MIGNNYTARKVSSVVTAPPFYCPFVFFCFVYFFRFFNYSVYICYSLVSPVIVRLRNVSYFRVHFFICCLYCLVQLLLPLVFQLPLSLCFSRRSRHTNLVSLVIFLSFLLALFVFRFGFLAALYIQLFMCVMFSANRQ